MSKLDFPAVELQSTVLVWSMPDHGPTFIPIDEDQLTDTERSRADMITHAGARARFVRGRLLMRQVLGRFMQLSPQDVPIVIDEFGKPRLQRDGTHSRSNLEFNLSHTEGLIVLAVSDLPIGIDAECLDSRRDFDGLVQRYFTPPECQSYFDTPAELRPHSFMQGWTCKEAVLKAVGTGLRDLNQCIVEMDPRKPVRVWQSPDRNTWQLTSWILGNIHVALANMAHN